jgi:hypothetical protein
MKKPIAIVGTLLVAMFFLWSACQQKKESESPPSPTQKDSNAVTADTVPVDSSKYILLSQLAFKKCLFKNNVALREVRSLYQLAQKEAYDFAVFLDNKNYKSQGLLEPNEKGEFVLASLAPVNFAPPAAAARSSDVCLCPNSTSGLCPCPGYFTTLYFVASSNTTSVRDGDEELTPEPLPGATDDTWRGYRITKVENRKFTLTITVTLPEGPQKYAVPMVIKDGMLYLDNERLQSGRP